MFSPPLLPDIIVKKILETLYQLTLEDTNLNQAGDEMAKKETELYPPVKAYMEQRGYLVRSEVRDCDLAAVKDGHLVVVELKTRFNLDLILQGVDRQRLCPNVYLAVP